jgi:hypothetical protein
MAAHSLASSQASHPQGFAVDSNLSAPQNCGSKRCLNRSRQRRCLHLPE